MSRKELLEELHELRCSRCKPNVLRAQAEDLLLIYIADKEIERAWVMLSASWWKV